MERRHLADDAAALVPEGFEDRGYLVAFTERTGGVSDGDYAAMNLALHTGDDPGAVAKNRSRLLEVLDLPPPALPQQVHGDRVVRVGAARAGAGWQEGAPVPGADGLTATQPRVPLAVLVADCLPVALASPREGILAVVHAGWRGLAAGILDRAMAAFERPGGVRAAIGPAIGPCHYEVGEDVALAVAAGSSAGAATDRRQGALFLDLPRTAAKVLRAAGVRHIDDAETCTACEADRFYSYRRDGATGRQALLAMRL